MFSQAKKASTGLRSFQLIDEDKLEDCKRDFDVDCSLQLYSLQQTVSSSSTQQLVYSVLQQVADFLGTEEGTEKFVNRGALQAANLNVKPPGQRIRACTELHRLDGGETKGPSAFSTNKVATGVSEKKKATSVQNFFGAGGGSSGGAKMAEKKDAGKPPLPSSVVLGLDPTKVIPSPKKDLKRAPRGNDGSPSEGVLTAIVEEDEEDEWDDGRGYKTDKKNVHKRGKIVVEEEDEDVEDRPPIDITLTEEDKELIARQLGTEKPAKVGAMDVFVSDSTTQVIGGLKKKKKKLVEKTFLDDRGYMVTEMVTEEVTDDESSPKKPSAPAASVVKPKAAPPQKKTAESAASSGGGKPQKAISSFFGKK